MRLTMVVRMPRQKVQPFIEALRANASGKTATFTVGEWRGDYGSAFAANSNLYEAALDDARKKASAIAVHSGLQLGPVRSVTEFSGGAAAVAQSGGPPLKAIAGPVTINDRIVTLAVEYTATNGIPIAVFGRADAAQSAPQGVSVDVYANAASIEDARRTVDSAEALVDKTASGVGIAPASITVTSAGFGG